MRKKTKKNIRSYKVVFSSLAYKWYFLLSALLIMVAFLTSGHGTFQLVRLKIKKDQLKLEKIRLEKENKRLINQYDSLSKHPESVEKIAREKYNMAKPGEEIYQVVPE